MRTTLVGSLLAVLACGCDRAMTPFAKQGDTTRVFAEGDGEWGPPFAATEVLRVAPDRKETAFGSVRALVARPDGGVLVFDEEGAEGIILRSFDSSGKFERNIGRSGRGPGEYSSDHIRFALHSDGTILINEHMRGLTRYAADGRLLNVFSLADGWQVDIIPGEGRTFYTTALLQPFAAGSSDSIPTFRARVGVGAASKLPQELPFFHYDTAGRILDTLMLKGAWLDSPQPPWSRAPSQRWSPLPDGRILVTRTDRLGIVIVDPKGVTPPILSEVPTVPVPFIAEELAEQQAAENASSVLTEGGKTIAVQKAERIAEYKLATQFSLIDTDGRIWLSRNSKSEKTDKFCIYASDEGPGGTVQCKKYGSYRSRPIYLGFRSDGRFLGEVRFPFSIGGIAFTGDYAWAMMTNEDDEPVLTKFRVRK